MDQDDRGAFDADSAGGLGGGGHLGGVDGEEDLTAHGDAVVEPPHGRGEGGGPWPVRLEKTGAGLVAQFGEVFETRGGE
jgi:hypothetical protein